MTPLEKINHIIKSIRELIEDGYDDGSLNPLLIRTRVLKQIFSGEELS